MFACFFINKQSIATCIKNNRQQQNRAKIEYQYTYPQNNYKSLIIKLLNITQFVIILLPETFFYYFCIVFTLNLFNF